VNQDNKTLLYPNYARFKPSQKMREKGLERNQKYKREDFHNLEDWFFYTHIDPVQRIIHAIGMFVGLFFFALCFYSLAKLNVAMTLSFYGAGVFFYYVSGIISHQFYDAGTGRSHPKFLLPTFIPVIKINLATTCRTYDSELRAFVKKYPFVKEAYELVEVPYSERFSFLRRP
jgi:hypothetical protein